MIINYYCPDFYNNINIYKDLIKYKKIYPEIFYNNVNIKYIFGIFPNMKWNGGSIFTSTLPIFESQIKQIKNFYEENNIPLQLTLTNTSLQEYHLQDEYCNNILKIMDNGLNEVLVSTDLMYDYISKNYPNYKINRSIVNTKNDYNWEEALDKKYNNIVMPRRYCKNLKYLSKIRNQYRNRIELLCNDPCPLDCPILNTHYKKYEELTLRGGPDIHNALICSNQKLKLLPFETDLTEQIKYQDIINNYIPIGYTEFKLAGRNSFSSSLIALAEYLIKPEYQMLFIKDQIDRNFYF